MTITELRELIANGENSGVEFKSEPIENWKLVRGLVAFANLAGGRLVLGVAPDGSVSGLTTSAEKLEEWVMQACRDKIRPALNPYFEILRDAAPGKSVAVVRVERGWSVHHVWHNNHRTYYVRVGSTNREASPEELARLFQRRQAFRAETRPVSGTSIENLDRRRLVDYFEHVREQPAPRDTPPPHWRERTEAWARAEHRATLEDLGAVGDEPQSATNWRDLMEVKEAEWREDRETEWQELLANTEFLGEEGAPKAATMAGLILFGVLPTRHLPQAKIDAVAYYGTEKDYDARERCTLRSPATPLTGADGTSLEPGLVEEAIDFVRRNIDTVRLIDGIRRTEHWDYPLDALREAIVNAIVHRDYLLSGTDIELSIYSDRLEIVSPGRLPNGITPERMRVGCRTARNELLKDVMRDYGYRQARASGRRGLVGRRGWAPDGAEGDDGGALEHMGIGVPRKIVRGMREHNGTVPDLIAEEEQFTVRLWKSVDAQAESRLGR